MSGAGDARPADPDAPGAGATSRRRAPDAARWGLDPGVVHLNHGSFGACPTEVLAVQQELRARLEARPMGFFLRDYEGLLDAARGRLADLVGADPADVVLLPNATAGCNAVLRSLAFGPGDELLVTDQSYGAVRNAAAFVAGRAGARLVMAELPFPLDDPGQIVEALLAAVTPATRLAVIDHVTSPTGLVLPLEAMVGGLRERGVDVLVDGAHAPGMVEVDLASLGAQYYTANAHKWLCAPKGAAFLWVAPERAAAIRPLAISHGATSPRTDRSRLQLEFDWTGTHDPTAVLSLPAAIEFVSGLRPGGLAALRADNRALVLAGRAVLARALGVAPPAPASMIGSLAALPLPDGGPPPEAAAAGGPVPLDPLQRALMEEHRIDVPVFAWPAPPRRLLRVSAQAYNHADDYEVLARVLRGRC